MEIGLYSFAENTPDPLNGGHLQSPAELVEEIHRQAGHTPPAPAASSAASYVPSSSV